MAAQPLVYVHGAGAQKPAQALKDELDQMVFGRQMPTTRVAYYADVRRPPAGPVAGPVAGRGRRGAQPGAQPSGRAARDRAVRVAASPQLPPKAAAAAIVAAALGPAAAAPASRRGGPVGAGGRAAGRQPQAEPAPQAAEAQKLVEQMYRYADRVAARSAAAKRGPVAGISFPDPIFRLVVGTFASDVLDYLFGGFAQQMRTPVRQALLNGPAPKVIVAHSLGTIILYDVLSEPAFAGFDVQLLVTVGCPLGIGNVQARLRDGAGRPNPVPGAVKAWANFADRFDPVALDRTLRDEFSPPKNFAVDESVNNPAKNNHDLTGYLSIDLVRSPIVAAVGQ
jgi:hypothetical protein